MSPRKPVVRELATAYAKRRPGKGFHRAPRRHLVQVAVWGGSSLGHPNPIALCGVEADTSRGALRPTKDDEVLDPNCPVCETERRRYFPDTPINPPKEA